MLIEGVSTNQHHKCLQSRNQSLGLCIVLQVVVWSQGLFHTQHGADEAKERVVSGFRQEIIDKRVKGKGYKAISKQLHVPGITAAHTVLYWLEWVEKSVVCDV